MPTTRRIVLIGPRGAGKSRVGELLAARLGMEFADADKEVERATGRRVEDLLAMRRFREDERRILRKLLARRAGVLAAGGGAVLWEGFGPATRGWTVVWLDADPMVLAARIRRDGLESRPSLTGEAPDLESGAVARERAPRYAACASLRIDTSSLGPEQVALRIEEFLLGHADPDPADAD